MTAAELTRDPREAKLPAWARTMLNSFRSQLSFHKAEIRELEGRLNAATGISAPVDSDTVTDAQLRLPLGTVVSFLPHENGLAVDDDRYVDVGVGEDGRVYADSIHRPLLIVPTNDRYRVELRVEQ